MFSSVILPIWKLQLPSFDYISKTHSEPSQTSKMDLFAKKLTDETVKYFRKKPNPKFQTGFWRHHCIYYCKLKNWTCKLQPIKRRHCGQSISQNIWENLINRVNCGVHCTLVCQLKRPWWCTFQVKR